MLDVFGGAEFHRDVSIALLAEAERLDADAFTLDLTFLVYLRKLSRFGFFTFGPINIDVKVVEDIVERTLPRGGGATRSSRTADDLVRFTQQVIAEARRSGRQRIDELHYLLAFMRIKEGLPYRVFGELGVSPEEVEEYAKTGKWLERSLERLYTPEEAAEYLGVHVQTVRGWIRSGRLKAHRLAGQRALRITASELKSVLEPVGGRRRTATQEHIVR